MFILEKLPFHDINDKNIKVNCQIHSDDALLKLTVKYSQVNKDNVLANNLHQIIQDVLESSPTILQNDKLILRLDKRRTRHIEDFKDDWDVAKSKIPDEVQFVINNDLKEDIFIPNKAVFSKLIEELCGIPSTIFFEMIKTEGDFYKINIITNNEDLLIAESNFFNFTRVPQQKKVEIPEKTLQLLDRYSQNYKVNFKLGIFLDDLISLNFVKNQVNKGTLEEIIHDFLSFLSNNVVERTYYFFGKENLQITFEFSEDLNLTQLIEELSEVISYLLIESKDYNKKLTIYRNALLSLKKGESEFIISSAKDSQLFNDAFKETMIAFDAMENEEIQSFLKYKKEILKEYMKFSNQLIESTKNYRNNLFKNILTIIGIFVSKELLNFSGDTSERAVIVLGIILTLFFIFSICFFDKKQYMQFSSKQKLLEKNFKYIPNDTLELKDEIEDIMGNELSLLRNVIFTSLTIYLSVLGLLLFWIV